jgi:sporulation protein YlmC with PRC-barrel domain
VIANPENHTVTHLVVKSIRPPFRETLAPVEQVEASTPDRIQLKCSRAELDQMEPFETEEYVQSELPGYIYWTDTYGTNVPPVPGYTTEGVPALIRVKRRNIPQDELAVRRGARVEATDGYVGQVDDLLVDPKTLQVIQLVLRERHIFQQREITIPVSQIDHVDEDTIFLKLDKQGVAELPTTPG